MCKLIVLLGFCLSVTTILSAQSPADTIDRGFFLETSICPQYRSSISMGAYEKINVGDHFHAIMDVQIAYDGQDIYNRLRFGMGARFDDLQLLWFMPQLNQKNWGKYNTPWGIELVADKKHLRYSAMFDFYKDVVVLSLKVRGQINVNRPNVKVRN